MPELYQGTTADFLEKAAQNRIAEDLRKAFVAYFGFEPPDSELRSWRNSLRALSGAIRLGRFTDHGLLLEYQLPLSSKRLDAMITGEDHDGGPAAVIVELKQWDDVEPSDVPECVGVRYGGRMRDVLHPSAQVGQYQQYLADMHTGFHPGGVRLSACSFLHDFIHDEGSELLAPRHANILGVYPLFAGDRIDELVQYLGDRIGGGRGFPILRTVREGRYGPHKRLLDHTARMIRNEPAYVLLDEQKVVFNSILARVQQARDTDHKAVFIVRGGPGTGKSVLALNLMAELAEAGYVANHATGSSAFTQTIRRIVGTRASGQFKYFNSYLNAEENLLDVLICDEAHRIREHSWDRYNRGKAVDPERPQIDELLSIARVAVFFIDDMQVVRRNEIGQSSAILEAAEAVKAPVFEYELDVQFRCGGSDGFVRWIENTLGIRKTANALWSGEEGFDFQIVESAEELDRMIRERHAQGSTARIAAGYCWPWSKPREDGTLVEDVQVGSWARPWNAQPNSGRLARGIPKSHLWASEPGGLEQVGCVYTAQGFEFDYAGVIFGPDLIYRPRVGWVGRPEFSHDGGLKRGTSLEDFTALVKNTYRVLLSRGLKGCYVYFMDEPTRTFFESRMDAFSGLEYGEGRRVAEPGADYGAP
jgi:uncharacterized protein